MDAARLQNRPLLDTARDAELFVDIGGVLDALARPLARDLNVLLHGRRGAGATTLLRVLTGRLSRQGRPAAFVQAARATSAIEALDLVRGAVAPGSPSPDVASALSALGTVPAGTRFLVDNLDPALAHQLFGMLRDDLWTLEATWMVTATTSDLPLLRRPPADAFFEVVLDLPSPTRAEAEELLSRRLPHAVTLPDDPGLTPRELIAAARTDDPEGAVRVERGRRARLASLGAPAETLGRLLLDRGTVSAADPGVQSDLGWTASRISQVLATLTDAGLVTYDDVRPGGPGRPQRRYRWATDDA